MHAHIHGIISGRVQMVMFRDFLTRKARKLNLTGFVRNLSGGTVEFVAEGEKDALNKLIEHAKKGPVLAEVKDVGVEWKDATDAYKRFAISYE